MTKHSAGLLLFRRRDGEIEVLLAHPGGPFWRAKDAGAWSIPKGEYGQDEAALSAARREFAEETGAAPPEGRMVALGEFAQSKRKIVTAFAVEADFDPARLAGATVEIEWPPRSGHREAYPEIDRLAWFPIAEARARILAGQRGFLDRLAEKVSREPESPRRREA
ncbi:NUDIX domain-containing protein [Enterovirga sp.]|uniref:NUDIX domain-containing protein n=1 Tax=Enterovirga sp. TaxID=2026350 RepID=UPI002CD6BDFA|nr:NUDIX domain-containing protein [Enterovirga sp.]HMO28695.1 NUDIX domain-containing protein [Enterovirga sp.]